MEIITDFIWAESMILIPALYILNLFLRGTPTIPVWLHPWIVLVFGVFACLLYYGWKIESVIQGILTAGVAILIKDLIHKTINLDKTPEDDNKH